MLDTGWVTCGTGAATGSGATWGDASAITSASDATYAYSDPDVAGTTQLLRATNFGFAIPTSGFTLLGVEARVRRMRGDNGATDATIQLTPGGSNKADAAVWPDAFNFHSYGGAADLWGMALTPADVNASTFGLNIAVTRDLPFPSSADVYVSYVQIKIYYDVDGVNSISAKAGGVWTTGAPSVKKDGSWQTPAGVWVKVSGVWTLVFG